MGGGLTTYDYGFRIYNPTIAKFLSVDPLTASYPWYTPYQFAGNMPIWAIDLDGIEAQTTNGEDPCESQSYSTPNGGLLQAPGISNAEFFDDDCGYVNDCEIQVMPGSLRQFDYLGETYKACADANSGEFLGYFGPNGQAITQSSNTLPENIIDNTNAKLTNFAGALAVGTSGASQTPYGRMLLASAMTGMYLQLILEHPLNLSMDFHLYPPSIFHSPPISINSPPFEITLPYSTTDGITTAPEPNGGMLLFRGVSYTHPGYSLALSGTALPIGGPASAIEHNLGNTNSNFTSWTSNPWVAYQFATNNYREHGVILAKRFNASEMVYSPDKFLQNEVLVRGPVIGALPLIVINP